MSSTRHISKLRETFPSTYNGEVKSLLSRKLFSKTDLVDEIFKRVGYFYEDIEYYITVITDIYQQIDNICNRPTGTFSNVFIKNKIDFDINKIDIKVIYETVLILLKKYRPDCPIKKQSVGRTKPYLIYKLNDRFIYLYLYEHRNSTYIRVVYENKNLEEVKADIHKNLQLPPDMRLSSRSSSQ